MSPLSFVRIASPATSVVACNRGLARARATPDIFFFLCRCSVSLFHTHTHTHRSPRVWCLLYFWQKKVPEPHPVEGEGPCGSRGPRQEMRCPFCVVKNYRGFFTGWEEDEEEREVEKQKKKLWVHGLVLLLWLRHKSQRSSRRISHLTRIRLSSTCTKFRSEFHIAPVYQVRWRTGILMKRYV